MVLTAVGGVAVVEQPSSSILTEHPAFKQLNCLLRKLKIPATRLTDCVFSLLLQLRIILSSSPACAKIWRQRLWMRHYDHDCCKPTYLWPMSPAIRKFFRGKLNKKWLPAKRRAAQTYLDSQGQKHFKGGKDMKESQQLALQSRRKLVVNNAPFSFLSSQPRIYPVPFAGQFLRLRKLLLAEKPNIPEASCCSNQQLSSSRGGVMKPLFGNAAL